MTALSLAPTEAQDRYVCAYVRISDDRTGEQASITRQKALIRKLADQRGIDPDDIVWFEDRSKSASHGVRPDFRRLLDTVRAGEASMVLVWLADRLWRNDDDRVEIGKVFSAAGIMVHAAEGMSLDYTNEEGEFVADMVGATSKFEVKRKKRRVRVAAEDRAKKGRFGGGVRRFGYQQRDTRIARKMDDFDNVTEVERPSGPLVLVAEEAQAIKDGYRMLLEGASLNAVTRDWRARGLVGVQGGPLTPMVVRGVLLRPANAGLSTYKGEVVGTGEWPAIIDPDTWADAKALLEDPSRRTNVGRPATHLLSGILRCAACGTPMRASSKGRGDGGQEYRCSAGRTLPDKPGQHVTRRRLKIDAAVSELLLSHLIGNAAKITRPDKPVNKTVAKSVAEATKLRGKIDAYTAQAANFDPADLAGLLRTLRAQLSAVEAKIVTDAGRPATAALVAAIDIPAAWAALSVADKRVIIKENIDRIEVGPGKQGARDATMHNVRIYDRDGRDITA